MLTKKIVKKSIEAEWRKRQIFLWIGIIAISVGLMLLFGIVTGMKDGNLALTLEIGGIFMLIYRISFMTFVLFCVYKYVMLFKDLNNYQIYEVVLNTPRTSRWYRGAVYYTVTIKLEDGTRIAKDTKPLWSDIFFSKFRLSDYNNQKIHIAYNAEADKMIVIG